MTKRNPMPPEVRHLVILRAGGYCELCATRPGGSVHHRKPQQMGGTRDPLIHSLANLLLVCGTGTTGCHQRIESNRALAYQNGWLVHRSDDPAKVPVMRRGRMVLLAHTGDVERAD